MLRCIHQVHREAVVFGICTHDPRSARIEVYKHVRLKLQPRDKRPERGVEANGKREGGTAFRNDRRQSSGSSKKKKMQTIYSNTSSSQRGRVAERE